MTGRWVRRYFWSTSAAFVALLAITWLAGAFAIHRPLLALAPLLGFAIAAEALVVRREHNSASFSVAAHIATAVLFGPLAAAVVAALGVILVDGLRLGPRLSVLMNASMFGIAAWLAGASFVLAGGTVGSLSAHNLGPICVLIAVRFLANEMILSVAVSLNSGMNLLRVLRDDVRDSLGTAIGEGSLGALVAFGYSGERWVILPFLAPLLATMYQSQSSFEQLKSQTAAALNAFAGVIDERDVSTAQHSERVATYVERFVVAIGLPDREAERLVAAARFHDLGKVAVDVATLSRSGRLTEAELRAIRSHPRLSARLLSPFQFAKEMAVYAELHHERYDGNGYYSVPQRDIPVEAHVLICADSFDAMTSARAYRPALTFSEAVQEIRDKAGSQFHPLVAAAFAAMIELRDVEDAMGATQLAALRAEFERIPTVSLPEPKSILDPAPLAVYAASASLVALGVARGEPEITLPLLAATALLGLLAVAKSSRERRCHRRALAALDASGSAAAALEAAGLDGCVAWLRWDAEAERFHAAVEAREEPPAVDVEAVCKRALRVGRGPETGQLDSGLHVALTPFDREVPRLAHWGRRPHSPFEVSLLVELAERCSPPQPVAAVPVAVPEEERRGDSTVHAVLVVELNAFEDVRTAAGQLTAERLVLEASERLRALMRSGDRFEQIDDDRFAVLVSITDNSQAEIIMARITYALEGIPVPHRAASVSPTVKSWLLPSRAPDPELDAVLAHLYRDDQRAAS
jgi:GGDEF domain-containing protein